MRNLGNMICMVVIAACFVSASPAADVSGTWNGEINSADGGFGRVRLVLKQVGGQISGTAGPIEKQNPPRIYDAKLEGDHLTFSADDSDPSGLKLSYRFDLTVTGDRIQGKAMGTSSGRSWTMDLSATRQK